MCRACHIEKHHVVTNIKNNIDKFLAWAGDENTEAKLIEFFRLDDEHEHSPQDVIDEEIKSYLKQ